MLVLTRKTQEQIRIGEDITISVLRIKGNSVRVGIEAPRDVQIVRGELPRHAVSPAKSCPAEDREKPSNADSTPAREESSGCGLPPETVGQMARLRRLGRVRAGRPASSKLAKTHCRELLVRA